MSNPAFQQTHCVSNQAGLVPETPGCACLVAIGASAGGPAALAKLLGALPADFPAALVIVQHMDEAFAPGLADWLDGQAAIEVRLARTGSRPQPGVALLAGQNRHLMLADDNRLVYTQQPTDLLYRPSIDVFFKSVDCRWKGRVVGVLLTGMGRDGVEALRSLRHHGHHTIAQNEATSAVYGMPKAAAECQAAAEILDLKRIGFRLNALARQSELCLTRL